MFRSAFAVGILGVLLAGGVAAAAESGVVPPAVAQRAWAEGRVRVIVQLGVPAAPEGTLAGPAHIAVQRQDIAAAQGVVLSALRGLNARLVHHYQTVPFLALEVGPDGLTALESLQGAVVQVHEDSLARPALAESTPLVQATSAWAAGFEGTGVTVAILDTGIDRTHSFFTGKIVREACFSSNLNCPNGQATQIGPGAAAFCTYAPTECDHGTHVAGIAVGRGASFSGVARGATVVPIQVFSRFTGSTCDGGPSPCALSFTSDQMAALEHVFNLRTVLNFASVNMSLGGSGSATPCDTDALKPLIDNLRSVGIATVIASGNDGSATKISHPACISTAVSVGSTDDGSGGSIADQISFFSNRASFLSLLAPGRFITSSVPVGAFAVFQGTSMASPHVAGAFAVIRQAKPTATVSQILAALRNTGLPIVDSTGITYRRIRILDAINSFVAIGCAPGGRGAPGKGDYDGDGKADIGVYRSSTGEWLVRASASGGLQSVAWGAPALNDMPVPGDYDGDDKTDVAVYRCSTGQWFVRRSSDAGLTLVAWGAPMLGDVPIQGDYDGDGQTDVAVHRTSTGQWFVRRSSDGALLQVAWGAPVLSDIPVPGDYDGDGQADIAVYRRSDGQWFVRKSSDGALLQVAWGAPALNDAPVPADYDGDGTADIAVYRQSTGQWFIRKSSDGGLLQVAWGAPALSDAPVPGDYDGDGKADVAVYRQSAGVWFILRSTDQGLTQLGWGAPSLGDTALTPR